MESLNKDLLKEFSKQAPINVNKSYDAGNVYTFVSIDLTNSTKFKVEQSELWKTVIAGFYDKIFEAYGINHYETLIKDLPPNLNIKFWKFVGDEVLLYVPINNRNEIYEIVKATDELVKQLNHWIADYILKFYECSGQCLEEIVGCTCPFRFLNNGTCKIKEILSNSLGAKATIWIAVCGKSNEDRNIIHVTSSSTSNLFGNDAFDFLGPEIDEGFRIAKFAVNKRVVVSPFLVNILHRTAKDDAKAIIESNFRIISYQKLKGVWRERPFPIVMYSTSFKNFHEAFDYDEMNLSSYSGVGANGFEEKRCQITYLNKILNDVNLNTEIDKIIKILSDKDLNSLNEETTRLPVEIHIACACFDKNGLLLVHNHKIRGWEFGCVRITDKEDNWKSVIESGYRKKYGLEISVDNNPIPIATYIYRKMHKSKKIVFGLIVLGKFINYVNIDDGKHKENFEAMPAEKIENLVGEKAVDNFVENAQKAFAFYEVYGQSLEEKNNQKPIR